MMHDIAQKESEVCMDFCFIACLGQIFCWLAYICDYTPNLKNGL